MYFQYFCLIMLILISVLQAQNKKAIPHSITDYAQQDDRVTMTLFNINNISGWVNYNGSIGHTPDHDAGIFYPRGTSNVSYIDGMLFGAYVRDGNLQNPRVGGCTYNSGLQPGWIITPGTSGASSAVSVALSDPRVRVYRIRADWLDLYHLGAVEPFAEDLRRDAAEVYMIPPNEITDNQMYQVWQNYQKDWQDWPADLGAPFYDVNGDGQYTPGVQIDLNQDGIIGCGETEEPGMVGADQVLWFVCNDLDQTKTIGLYGSDPMGLEIQTTIWGYRDSGPVGDMSFLRRRLINKSGVRIDSMFIGLWSDPDLGWYPDDLAGCDTILDLVYVYNGASDDRDFRKFGLPPPSYGYTLLQGPVVTAAGEQAWFDMRLISGFRNLPMTSVFFQVSGSAISDPSLDDYDGTLEWYNALNGFIPTVNLNNPTPWTVGNEGRIPTKFWLSGDPVTGYGDVDGLRNNFPPGDRRFGTNTGPFNMAPGDKQEVIYAMVGGLGRDQLSSIVAMKYNVSIARYLHANRYQVPEIPPAPSLEAMSRDGKILLNWQPDYRLIDSLEQRVLSGGYNFEGYNLWQLPAGSTDMHDAVRIATFDKVTPPAAVKGPYLDLQSGLLLLQILAWGTNSGIERQLLVGYDYLTGQPFIDGKIYRFAVSTYYYNAHPENPFPVRESDPVFTDVTAYSGNPGYGASFDDTLHWVHSSGKSQGSIQVEVVDPSQLTGHNYEIRFIKDSTDFDNIYFSNWLLYDLTLGDTVLLSREVKRFTPLASDMSGSAPVVDGLRITVMSPEPEFTSFQVVANAAGMLDPPEQGCFAFNNNGFPLLNGNDRPDGARQQTNGSTWGIHHNTPNQPNYSQFVTRVTQYSGGFGETWPFGIEFLMPRDYEIRFTGTPSPAFFRWPYLATANPAFMGTVPFELWCIGDADDPTDDYQCFPWISDDDSSGTFNLLNVDHGVSGGNNDPYTDAIYWLEPLSRNQAGYNVLVAGHYADPAGASAEVLWAYRTAYDPWNCVAGMARMVFVNMNGGDVSEGVYNAELPEPGTVFRIVTSKPLTEVDVFSFTAPGAPDIPNQFRLYQNYPNPFNNSTTFRYWVPRNSRVVLEIYNILGQKVSTLVDDIQPQGEYFRTWNSVDVASGMYFYRLRVGGQEQLLKMVLVK